MCTVLCIVAIFQQVSPRRSKPQDDMTNIYIQKNATSLSASPFISECPVKTHVYIHIHTPYTMHKGIHARARTCAEYARRNERAAAVAVAASALLCVCRPR